MNLKLTHFASGPSGYITAEIIKKHAAPPSLGNKVKIFVCGTSLHHHVFLFLPLIKNVSGPPGHVAAVAGKKAGFKQGELSGSLKELGYTEDQVGISPDTTFTVLIYFLGF